MTDIIDFSAYRKHKKLRKTSSPKLSKKAKKNRQHHKPDRQGQHDSLCGLYTIVNALNAIHRFNEADREQIFKRLIQTLEQNQSASDAIIYGTCKSQMEAMIKEAVAYVNRKHKVRIAVKPLFRRKQRISVKSFWRVLRLFLGKSNRCSIIIGIRGAHDHWTCARAVSQFTIKLLDSDGIKRLRRRSCRIGKPYTEKHYHLLPTQVWGISLTD